MRESQQSRANNADVVTCEKPGISACEPAVLSPNRADWPLVTVIVPILNEAGFIETCLTSILRNDYPAERMEILVVDGMSTDGTRDAVARMAAEDSRVRLLDNPQRVPSFALNRGIREARGSIIVRIDGHAEVAGDFLLNSVKTLIARPECWVVGGAIETVSETFVGRTIAAAMSTPVGVGNAMFRMPGYEGYVDTIAFGAHWRWVFDRIGLFDEEIARNQDDEFNARLINAGGKIFMTQSIRSRYFPRSSLRKLWRQYFQYGFWRIRTIQKLGKPATPRQVAPLLFVSGMIVLGVASLVWSPMAYLWAAYLLAYGLGLVVGACQVARKAGVGSGLLSPVVFAILHFAYGLGSLQGIWVFSIRRRSVGAAESSLSR